MRAVILAGGAGTRLRDAVPDRPKAMALVGGRPFLSYLLDQLSRFGARCAVLALGRGHARIEAYAASRGQAPPLLRTIVEPEPRGTGGALAGAAALTASSTVLVMNGDTYADVDLAAFLASHRSRGAAFSVATAVVDDDSRYGLVRSDAAGRLLGFDEKPAGSGGGRASAGICLVERSLLEAIPAGRALSLERDLLPRWPGGYAWDTNGHFLDIGTPESYARAEDFLRRATA